jgi:hypothetical protein
MYQGRQQARQIRRVRQSGKEGRIGIAGVPSKNESEASVRGSILK